MESRDSMESDKGSLRSSVCLLSGRERNIIYPPVNKHGNGKWIMNSDVFPIENGDISLPCWFTGW